MARLPVPGADANTWGDILNTYLQVSHTADGSLSASAVDAAISAGSIDEAQLADDAVSLRTIASSNVAGNNQVLSWNGTALEWVDPGTPDHGSLSGLGDDDHPQYALADGTRGSFATTAQGALADTAVQPGDLSSYPDATGRNAGEIVVTDGANGWAYQPLNPYIPTAKGSSVSTGSTVNLPAEAEEGDFCLIFWSSYSTSAGSAIDDTAPAGFTIAPGGDGSANTLAGSDSSGDIYIRAAWGNLSASDISTGSLSVGNISWQSTSCIVYPAGTTVRDAPVNQGVLSLTTAAGSVMAEDGDIAVTCLAMYDGQNEDIPESASLDVGNVINYTKSGSTNARGHGIGEFGVAAGQVMPSVTWQIGTSPQERASVAILLGNATTVPLTDAPSDGTLYARKDGFWEQIANVPDPSGESDGRLLGVTSGALAYQDSPGGATAINDLTDVNTTGANDGDGLVYTQGAWLNTPTSTSASEGANPDNSWDGNSNTYWFNTIYGVAWTRADYGSPVTVTRCTITGDGALADWVLEYSDDDSAWTQVGGTLSISAQPDTDTITFPAETHRYWRLYSSATSYVQLNIWLYGQDAWVPQASSGVAAIDDLTDVDTSTVAPTTDQALVWDGSNWVPGSVASVPGVGVLPSVRYSAEAGAANWTTQPLSVNVVNGDMIVAWAHSNLSDRVLSLSDDAGLTWTEQGQAVVGDLKMALWTAVVTASGTVGLTFTQSAITSGGVAAAVVQDWAALDITFATTNQTATGTPTATSMNVGEHALVLMYAATANGTDGAAPPAEWTEYHRRVYASGRAHSLSSEGYLVAGETGLIEFTSPVDDTRFVGISLVGTVVPGSLVSALDDLSDVDTSTTAPTDGQALVWDTDKWVPTTVSTVDSNATIEVISTATNSNLGAGTTGVDVTTGAVAANDLIVVVGSQTNNTANMATPTATGLTFTEVMKSSANAANPDIGIWWAISPDATQRTITVSTDDGSASVNHAAVFILRGIDPDSPIDATNSDTTAFSATTTPTVTAITPNTTNALVFVAMVGTNNGSGYASAPFVTEPGWTSASSQYHPSWGGMALARQVGQAATAPGTVAFEQPVSCAGVSVSFAIRPAIVPGSAVPSGGTAGQVLAKASGGNYDTEWVDNIVPGDDAATLGSGAATSGYVLTADGAGGATWGELVAAGHTVNVQTGTSYTLALSDNEKLITLDNTSAIVVTIPENTSVALPIGTHIYVAQIGTGRIVLQGSATVSLNGQQSLGVKDGYGTVELLKVATDEWSVSGDWESPPTPSFVSATTSAGGTSIASPSGIQEGDLLIGLMGSQNGSPTLEGFTNIAGVGGGLARSNIFVKRATASEPGTYAITGISGSDEGSLHLSAWRNAAILESAGLPIVQTVPTNSTVVFPEQDLGSPGYPLVQTVKYDSAAAITYTSADNYSTLYSVQVGGAAGTFSVRATTAEPVWIARQLTMTPPTTTGENSAYAGCQRIFIVYSDQTAPTNVADLSSGGATDGHVATADGAGGVAWEAPPAGGHTIEDETVALPQRTNLDFKGAGVTVTDDSGNDRTIVTIPGAVTVQTFSRAGTLSLVTGTSRWYPPGTTGATIAYARASVGTAPVGDNVDIGLLIDGLSVATLTITDGTYTSGRTTINEAIADGSYLTIDITNIGSATAGSDLTVQLEVE